MDAYGSFSRLYPASMNFSLAFPRIAAPLTQGSKQQLCIDSRELEEHGGLPGVTREYRRTITAGKWGEERRIQLA